MPFDNIKSTLGDGDGISWFIEDGSMDWLMCANQLVVEASLSMSIGTSLLRSCSCNIYYITFHTISNTNTTPYHPAGYTKYPYITTFRYI